MFFYEGPDLPRYFPHAIFIISTEREREREKEKEEKNKDCTNSSNLTVRQGHSLCISQYTQTYHLVSSIINEIYITLSTNKYCI